MSLVSISSHAMYNGADTVPFRGMGSVLQKFIKLFGLHIISIHIHIISWRENSTYMTTKVESLECNWSNSLSLKCLLVFSLWLISSDSVMEVPSWLSSDLNSAMTDSNSLLVLSSAFLVMSGMTMTSL